MPEPFIGEIRMFAGNFAPAGWAFCNGQLVPISENDALFILIGTTYGGDGQETFALPNLQSRIPIHQGQGGGTTNHILGETGGTESVTLTVQQIPSHTHPASCSSGGGTPSSDPNNATWAKGDVNMYSPGAGAGFIGGGLASAPAGGSQPHDNMVPYLCINYIISLFGIFPQQN
jgi:microcystin-dependent protein